MTISQDADHNEPKTEGANEKQAGADAEIIDIKDAKIAQLEEECAKLRDNWVRSVAETDNIRKRSQRDLEENGKYAISGFAGDMVSVLENLKRAAEIISSGNTAEEGKLLEKMGEGIDLTIQELLGIFKKYNIVRLDPIGQKFDHNFHQAVAQVEDNKVEAGTVLQVIQAGYVIADRLLRPAMVVVAKNSGDTAKKLDTTA